MNFSGWLGLTESDWSEYDLAHLNLAVFYGRAPRDSQRDLEETTILQEWVELVRTGIANSFARYRNTAAELSDPEFAMLVMATVLHRNLGLAYKLPFNEGPYNASDPANLFLTGLLCERRGSCVTMPMLSVAIGRQLGYPLHLVLTKSYVFCRWDDSGGVRFNVEAAKHGYQPVELSRLVTTDGIIEAGEFDWVGGWFRGGVGLEGPAWESRPGSFVRGKGRGGRLISGLTGHCVLQLSRFAAAEELAHDLAQVVPRDCDQVALRHVDQPAEPGAALAAGVADVGERTLALLTAYTLQLFALGTLHAASIV